MILCDRNKCTACEACVNMCPNKCISLGVDKHGFAYPKIEATKCMSCGLCQKVCHVLNPVELKYPVRAYATWSNEPEERKTSTSGGVAAVFYQQMLKEQGFCFGAMYDDTLNVVIRGYADERIRQFKKSKYVHSDMNDSFVQIKRILSEDKKVIFIGLPCQVAALKTYLGKEYANLILVDIVCHGTPPLKHFKEHITHINERKGKITKDVTFRQDNSYYFMCSDGNNIFYNKRKEVDCYMLAFGESLNYYESCYSCKYACNKRVSDITIGDFWGLGEEIPFEHPYSGAISLVLINTKKGEEYFETVREKVFCEERTVEEALKGNSQLNCPSEPNAKREVFLQLYEKYGFEKATKRIFLSDIRNGNRKIRKYNFFTNVKCIVKKILRR